MQCAVRYPKTVVYQKYAEYGTAHGRDLVGWNMINKKGLRNQGGSYFQDEEVNPMAGVANLVDAMLVLACGLMMSIVIFYNVDLKGVKTEIREDNMQEVDAAGVIDEEGNIGEGYESMGTVYEDTETGKLYIVTPGKQITEGSEKEEN